MPPIPEGSAPSGSWHLAVRDDIAVVVTEQGAGDEPTFTLRIIDLRRPAQPAQHAAIPLEDSVYHLAFEGQRLWLLERAGLRQADLSRPDAPVLSAPDPHMQGRSGMTLAGRRAFLRGAGLEVVDLAVPTAPRITGAVPTIGTLGSLATDGRWLYAQIGDAVQVYELRPAGCPRWATSLGPIRPPLGLAHEAGNLYVAHRDGLSIYATPTTGLPRGIGALEGVDLFRGARWATVHFAVGGGMALLADNTGVRIVDVADPARPALRGAWETEGVRAVAADERFIYLLRRPAGQDPVLEVIEARQAQDPRLVGSLSLSDDSFGRFDLRVVGPQLYVANGERLRIVDVSEPSAMRTVGAASLPHADMPFGSDGAVLDVADGRAAVYAGPTALVLFDVHDPRRPRPLARTHIVGSPVSIALAGTHVFLSLGSNGLRVARIGQETAPPHPTPVALSRPFRAFLPALKRDVTGRCPPIQGMP